MKTTVTVPYECVYPATTTCPLMPTVLRYGPYRVYFYSQDLDEPPHVHVDRDDESAKFWLRPLRLAHNWGFPDNEINKIFRILREHELELVHAWKRHFGI